MRIRHFFSPVVLIIMLFFVSASSAFATSFSISAGGITPAPPDDILMPGPAPILTGIGVEVDAFSFGHLGVGLGSIMAVEFSVDAGSIGAGGSDVFAEAGALEAHTDIFSSVIGSATNTQIFDGDGVPVALPPAPPLGLVESPPVSPDNVDGYDKNPGPGLGFIWWSVDPLTATAYPPGSSPADVFVFGAIPSYSAAPVL